MCTRPASYIAISYVLLRSGGVRVLTLVQKPSNILINENCDLKVSPRYVRRAWLMV